MTRDIATSTDQAAAAEVVRCMDLALFEMDSGTVRVTGAPYDVNFDMDGDGEAELWRTLLGQGQVSGVEEGTELQSYGVTCTLSAIPLDVVALALAEPVQGRLAYFWRCFLDQDNSIIGSPVLIFSGRMDVMPIEIGTEAKLELSVESRLADWERSSGSRYTDAEQQRRCPGDRFFQFVPQAVNKDLTWGKA